MINVEILDMLKPKNKQENLTQQNIKKYTYGKNISILLTLICAILCLIIGLISLMIEGFTKKPSIWGTLLVSTYIIMMVAAIFYISYYDKKRKRLIQQVNTTSFKLFFNYFSNANPKKSLYFEMKDIFLYGIWHIVDTNSYLRIFSEVDALELDKDTIKNKISKKEFLVLSMFNCLTYRQEGILYRNQHIYMDQEKFLAIINAYAKIYFDDRNHTNEYLTKCAAIEKKYLPDKMYAIEHHEGLPNNIGIKERFINFSNDINSIIWLKKWMIFFAIVGFFVQPFNEITNEIVTKLFNGITIILLLVDVSQKSDKDTIH